MSDQPLSKSRPKRGAAEKTAQKIQESLTTEKHVINEEDLEFPAPSSSAKRKKVAPAAAPLEVTLRYWAGRGLMEVPRFCMAIAGRFPDAGYTDERTEGSTKDAGSTLDANLGRLPVADCEAGTVGQSAAINFLVASECGLMGGSTFEAAKIIEVGARALPWSLLPSAFFVAWPHAFFSAACSQVAEHLKEVSTEFRKHVPYGAEPTEEALNKFFDSEEVCAASPFFSFFSAARHLLFRSG